MTILKRLLTMPFLLLVFAILLIINRLTEEDTE